MSHSHGRYFQLFTATRSTVTLSLYYVIPDVCHMPVWVISDTYTVSAAHSEWPALQPVSCLRREGRGLPLTLYLCYASYVSQTKLPELYKNSSQT